MGFQKQDYSGYGKCWPAFRDVFRGRLGNYAPAAVEPMHIELKPGIKPFRAKRLSYSPAARKFMESFVQRVLEYTLGNVNTNAKCVAAPFLVTKSGPAKYRLSFDYRTITWPMPQIDSELAKLALSLFFAVSDFV